MLQKTPRSWGNTLKWKTYSDKLPVDSHQFLLVNCDCLPLHKRDISMAYMLLYYKVSTTLIEYALEDWADKHSSEYNRHLQSNSIQKIFWAQFRVWTKKKKYTLKPLKTQLSVGIRTHHLIYYLKDHQIS